MLNVCGNLDLQNEFSMQNWDTQHSEVLVMMFHLIQILDSTINGLNQLIWSLTNIISINRLFNVIRFVNNIDIVVILMFSCVTWFMWMLNVCVNLDFYVNVLCWDCYLWRKKANFHFWSSLSWRCSCHNVVVLSPQKLS